MQIRFLRTLAFSAAVIDSALAFQAIESLSFGHNGAVSHDHHTIPNWRISGEGDHRPQVLSDRLILTPPHPGNKRGSIWADLPMTYHEWEVEVDFRANGPERGGGNLQIWYTRDGEHGIGTSSLYTVQKFDGLVLAVDQYHNSHGGAIRGFLNDGTKSYKDHHSVDTLAFGQCNFGYRNLGHFTRITLRQTAHEFQVEVDGHYCFASPNIKLPSGYYFGVTAASAGEPDSFEIQKFESWMADSTSYQGDASQHADGGEHWQEIPHHELPKQGHVDNSWKYQDDKGSGSAYSFDDWTDSSLHDQPASSIKSQDEQFADVHNRLTVLNHQLNTIFQDFAKLQRQQAEWHEQVLARIMPVADHVAAMYAGLTAVKTDVGELRKDLEGKDYGEHLKQLHQAVAETSRHVAYTLPHTIAGLNVKSSPRFGFFVFIVVATQIMLAVSYFVYKKRKASHHQKYL